MKTKAAAMSKKKKRERETPHVGRARRVLVRRKRNGLPRGS